MVYDNGILPLVTKEITDIVKEEMLTNPRYELDTLERIEKENPLILDFLYLSAESSHNPTIIGYIGMCTYDFLDRSGKLPRVNLQATEEVRKEVESSQENSFAQELTSRLEVQNPLLIEFIARTTMFSDDKLKTAYVGLTVYRFLERQAELEQSQDKTIHLCIEISE